jgi:serine/threonine protein kinase
VTLEHPNILTAREFFFFSKEEYLVIILEYCPDGSLSNLVGKISGDPLKKVIRGIAEGLVYLHNKNIFHRDIKPENILMLEGIPKITDLGISKIMMNTSGVSGKTCTPFYEAPEVLYEEKSGKSADIWSFGIVALELLLGKRIWQLITGKLQPAGREDFPSKSMLSEIKEKDMRDLVEKMLIKKA